METFFGQYFPQLAVAALTPPLIFVFMAAFDVQTAYVFLAFALFTLIFPLLTTGWTGESSLQRRKAYSALGAEFLDAVQGLATLKAFGQSRSYGAMLAERSRHLYRSTMGVLAANITTTGLITLGISAGAGVALGWGALRVSRGGIGAAHATHRPYARRRGLSTIARAVATVSSRYAGLIRGQGHLCAAR